MSPSSSHPAGYGGAAIRRAVGSVLGADAFPAAGFGRWARRASAALLVLLAFSPRSFANEEAAPCATNNLGKGHFSVKSLAPARLFRPDVAMSTLANVRGNEGRIRVDVDWANVWNYERGVFVIDGEWVYVSTRLLLGVWDDLELFVNVPVAARFGGAMDGMIESTHDAIGQDNDDREAQPRNSFLIDLTAPDGDRFVLSNEDGGLSDVSLQGAWLMTRGGGRMPAVALQALVTFPTGDHEELFGLGEMLYGGGVTMSKRAGDSPFLLFAGAHATYSDQDELAGIELERLQFSGMAGLEYEASPSLSWLVQYTTSSPVAKDYYEFSESIHELHVGFKKDFANGTSLELAFTENIVAFNNSADFGIHLGIGRSL